MASPLHIRKTLAEQLRPLASPAQDFSYTYSHNSRLLSLASWSCTPFCGVQGKYPTWFSSTVARDSMVPFLMLSLLACWRSCPTAAPAPPLRQDPLQAPHGGCQATQVPSLLQELRQHVLPGPAPPHPFGGQTLHVPLLPEGVPPALPPTAAHTVRAKEAGGPAWPPVPSACTYFGAHTASMQGEGGG